MELTIQGYRYMEGLLEFLSGFITPRRRRLFDEVLSRRTRHFTVVLEDIYQAQNASAVLRTCDCLGIQDVHIIENLNRYQVNPDVTLGSSKWLTLVRHNSSSNNTPGALRILRKEGYRIMATSPHQKGVPPEDADINFKTAIMFGNELKGLSDVAMEDVDGFLCIPMFGFTGSYNLSVSAAIILYQAVRRLRMSAIPWQVTYAEALHIKLQWVWNSLKNPEMLEKEYARQFSALQ
ncbi:MAG: RNA methyltransferase [Bacteroidales bacterium]|nr:RNA methyltransferase [Bacteroidales bacterium]